MEGYGVCGEGWVAGGRKASRMGPCFHGRGGGEGLGGQGVTEIQTRRSGKRRE